MPHPIDHSRPPSQPQPAPANDSSPYALEVAAKKIAELEAAKAIIPANTPVNIAFLGNETHTQRLNAARIIRQCGFEPVPIISARRLRSWQDLDSLLTSLIETAHPRRFIFVGGDLTKPVGPFHDAESLLRSGLIERYGIRNAGIACYPEGHPQIDTETLWKSLRWKLAFLQNAGCSTEITAQFGFDAHAILRWIERLRGEGIEATVRIGIPGPASTGTLLGYARQFGVATSTAVIERYGLSPVSLPHHVGPERFLDDLRKGMSGRQLGSVLYHVYPFGGIPDSIRWFNRYLAHHGFGRP